MTHTPAPIDAALLHPVAREQDRSVTLPARAYTAPDVLEWEQRVFFEGSWVCAGRATDLPNPQDQRAIRVGSQGIVLVRGDDGVLRGFFNACRHRGHELLPCDFPTVSARVIQCPYHAWTYGLDGTLKGAPRFSDVAGFDKQDYPLIPARIEEWHGWVFVNASGDAPPLAEHVGNLDGLLANYEIGRMFEAARHDYVVRANWKTITENYHECYHCPSIHPELCEVTPTDSGRNYEHTGAWVGGDMDLKDFAQTMSLDGQSKGLPIRGLDDYQLRTVLYVGLLPNMLISLHPDYVMTHRMEPLSPTETRVECAWLFPPEAETRPDFEPSYASDFWDITNRQDWAACESVTRGIASQGFRQGPFSWSEDEVHQFMAMIARSYLTGEIAVVAGTHGRGAAVGS
jgi:phenylpropionate dioxygenase-like ring-hydroxylating dioxygenase large terminal subunit